MKMMNKISTPVQISIVLLTFFTFAAAAAVHLNTPPTASAALKPPEAPGDSVPVNTALVQDLAAVMPADEAVCRDPEIPDALERFLAAATEKPQPLSDETAPVEPEKPEPPFHRLILQAADTHDVEPALIKAVIFAESNYNPKAVSKRGARGLMQLMPRTAASLGVSDPFAPEDNLTGGVKSRRRLPARFNNDVRRPRPAYKAGSRPVRNYNGVPPSRATRLYIKKVFKYQALFQEEMAGRRQTV